MLKNTVLKNYLCEIRPLLGHPANIEQTENMTIDGEHFAKLKEVQAKFFPPHFILPQSTQAHLPPENKLFTIYLNFKCQERRKKVIGFP